MPGSSATKSSRAFPSPGGSCPGVYWAPGGPAILAIRAAPTILPGSWIFDGGRMCHFTQWTFSDFTTQALRDDLRMVQIGFGQQHRKFFTTDPSEHVAR